MDADPVKVVTDSTIPKNELLELCRLCANTDNQLINIFNGEGLEHDIYKKIEKHIPIIKISEMDKLPLQICYQCASTLIAWHNLYEGCEAADKRLREILCIKDETIITDDNDDNQSELANTGFDNTIIEKCVVATRTNSRKRGSLITETASTSSGGGSECTVRLKRFHPLEPECIVNTTATYACSFCTATYNSESVRDHHTRVAHPELSDLYDAVEEPPTTTKKSRSRSSRKAANAEALGLKLIPVSSTKSEPVEGAAPATTTTARRRTANRKTTTAAKAKRTKISDESAGVATTTITDTNGDVSNVENMPIIDGNIEIKSDLQEEIVDDSEASPPSFRCEHCDYSTTKKCYIRNHIQRMHLRKRAGDGVDRRRHEGYSCNVCHNSFASKSSVRRHIVKVHAMSNEQLAERFLKGYACDFCNRGFISANEFIAHRTTHEFAEAMRWYQFRDSIVRIKRCDRCEYYYRDSRQWQNHVCRRRGVEGDTEEERRTREYLKQTKPCFKCKPCSLCFIDRWIYRMHHSIVHAEGEQIVWSTLAEEAIPYYCENCFTTFEDEQAKTIHECDPNRSSLEQQTAHVCAHCGSKYQRRSDFRRHLMRKHGFKKTTSSDYSLEDALPKIRKAASCPYCGESFRTNGLVLDHMKEAHNVEADSPYVCVICTKVFKRGNSLSMHNQVYHPVNENVEESNRILDEARIALNGVEAYHCDRCNRHYFEKLQYLAHWRLHNMERRYTCDLCGKQTRTQHQLNNHIKNIHLNIRNYNCDLCDKAFHNRQSCIEHRRIHTGEKPFSCETCGKTFIAMNALLTHQKFHNDFYAHSCHLCPKKFKIRRSLTNHIRTHTGERPFKCELCGKTYNNSSRFSYHKKVTHSENRPYPCELCGSHFKAKKFLMRHMKLHLTREGPIQFKRRNNPAHFAKLREEKSDTATDAAAAAKRQREAINSITMPAEEMFKQARMM